MTLPRCSSTAARVLLAGLLTLCLVTPCAAEKAIVTNVPKQLPPDILIPYGQRTDAFRRLLFEFRFQPRRNFGELQANPDKSLLIVLGEPGFLSKDRFPQGLRSFVARGGAVLIATDMKTEGEAGAMLSQLAGVTVTGETLVVRRIYHSGPLVRPFPRYGNSEYCPCLEPLEDSTAPKGSRNVLGALATLVDVAGRPNLFRCDPSSDQPTFQVATNAPSRLKLSGWWLPSGIHRLARLPPTCQDEKIDPNIPVGPDGPRFADKNGPLFAVGGTLGKGRVLVLADHSIFINRMILPRDNRNLEFAANCLHWLRGGVSNPLEVLRAANSPQAAEELTGQRNQVLFSDDGNIRTDFDVPLKTVPIKPSLDMAPAVAAALDRAVTRMEDENVFNRTLDARMEEIPGGRPRVLRNVVYALTLAAILFLGYLFLWRGRHRPEPAVPLLAHAVSQHEPKASLLEQRRRALLRSENVWEMAHQLARQYFESAGIPLTGNAAPHVAMRGSWRQRWLVRRRVTRLWELARGQAPARIHPAALNRWLRDLDELKTDLANGTIQLT